MVANNKPNSHWLKQQRKSGSTCFAQPEEGGSSDVFGSSPASQLAFPWLQDTSDKLGGSKMAV